MIYKCPKCEKDKAKVVYVKAGFTTDLYYLECSECGLKYEARWFELERQRASAATGTAL